MAINRVFVVGNLTRDVELSAAKTGLSVARFTVAVNDRKKVGDQWEDDPNYFRVTAFGKLADRNAPSLYKGARVAIDGRLKYDEWTDKEGNKRTSVSIIANEIVAPKPPDTQMGLAQSDLPF